MVKVLYRRKDKVLLLLSEQPRNQLCHAGRAGSSVVRREEATRTQRAEKRRAVQMGRPKDVSCLFLADPDGTPLPSDEFLLLDRPEFTVPFNDIKVVERNNFPIPGLGSTDEAIMKKYLDQKNVFPVKVLIQSDNGVELQERSFVVNGRTTVGDLGALVHGELDLNPNAQLVFSMDERVLAYDKLMMSVNEESSSPDGFPEIVCRIGLQMDEVDIAINGADH